MIPTGLTGVIRNLDAILEVEKVLTPDVIRTIRKVAEIDVASLKKMIESLDRIDDNKQNISSVLTGMSYIERVVEMQSQVTYVSDIRDSIGLVAGSVDKIKATAESLTLLDEIQGMGTEIDSVLKMKDEIREVLENKDRIEEINSTATGMQSAMQEIEDMYLVTKQNLEEMKVVRNDMEMMLGETRMQSDLAASAVNRLRTFQVKTFMIEEDRKGYSKYEPKENTLNLFIPKGKTGEEGKKGEVGRRGQRGNPGTAVHRGDPGEPGPSGRNGQNFRVDIFGYKRELKRFGNRVMGTSFVSLDENPVMVYFKKSDALDSWTDGQPFGISEGEDAKITVDNSQKLGGYTLEQIYRHIENAFNNKQRN